MVLIIFLCFLTGWRALLGAKRMAGAPSWVQTQWLAPPCMGAKLTAEKWLRAPPVLDGGVASLANNFPDCLRYYSVFNEFLYLSLFLN